MNKTANSRFSSTQIWTLAFVSPTLATAVHAYLLKSHYDLKFTSASESALCDMSETLSCSAATASPWSEFLGVPIALWGALANLALLFLLLTYRFLPSESDEAQSSERTQLRALAALIAGASVVMGAYSLLALKSLCPFCAVNYILSFVTAFSVYRLTAGPARWVPTKGFFALAISGLILGFMIHSQAKEAYVGKDFDRFIQAVQAEWKSNPTVPIENLNPLAMGASQAEAKMTIVEFADFRCIHCKNAVEPLKSFLKLRPDVRLEFYAWPLDGECNTVIPQKSGASCLLARLAWCAESEFKKGQMAHEELFRRFDQWKSLSAIEAAVPELAEALAVDTGQFKACASSDAARAAVKGHADLGIRLDLKGTPALFVNGKALPGGAQREVLDAVYQSLSR